MNSAEKSAAYSLKDLSHDIWTIKCSRYSMRPDYIPKRKFSDKTANGLTKAIIAYIHLKGGQAERISTTGRYIEGRTVNRGFYGVVHTKGKWIKGSGTPGSADISATINGKSVKIEVKIKKDRQSEAQLKYQQSIEKAGGIYLIAKDWTSFINQIQNI